MDSVPRENSMFSSGVPQKHHPSNIPGFQESPSGIPIVSFPKELPENKLSILACLRTFFGKGKPSTGSIPLEQSVNGDNNSYYLVEPVVTSIGIKSYTMREVC